MAKLELPTSIPDSIYRLSHGPKFGYPSTPVREVGDTTPNGQPCESP
jgi:hypothetical protein